MTPVVEDSCPCTHPGQEWKQYESSSVLRGNSHMILKSLRVPHQQSGMTVGISMWPKVYRNISSVRAGMAKQTARGTHQKR